MLSIKKRETNVDKDIALPFSSVEEVKKYITGVEYSDTFDLITFFTISETEKTNLFRFIITDNEYYMSKTLQQSNFLTSVINSTGQRVFIFVVKTDMVDNIDLTKKKFYENIIERNYASARKADKHE